MKTQVPEQIPLFAPEPARTFVSVQSFLPPPPAKPGPKRIDWFKVVTDVLRCGYSIQSAAEEIGVARTTLFGWRQGAEPRYSEGERLVQLWCRTTGEDRADIPMCSTSDWWAYHSKA